MFTGIIEEVGKVDKITANKGGRDLSIKCSFAAETKVDQSISVNGVCLTVTEKSEEAFTVQCVEETLRKTSLRVIEEGAAVNLERSMTMEQGIEGHLVQGHVDNIGHIRRIQKEEADWLYEIAFPPRDRNLIVNRGSIAIDGISLTVANVTSYSTFSVAIIPYTRDHTCLKEIKIGDPVNLEYDIIGKYVVRYLSNRQEEEHRDNENEAPITRKWLRDRGFGL